MPMPYSSTVRSINIFQRIQTRRIHGTPHRYSSPFFHLAALSASREGQFISKASGISRVDYTPNAQLLRAEACGSTIPEQRSMKRSFRQTPDQKPHVQKHQEQKPKEQNIYVRRDEAASSESIHYRDQYIDASRKSAASSPRAVIMDTHKKTVLEETPNSHPTMAQDTPPNSQAATSSGGTSNDATVKIGRMADLRKSMEDQKSLINYLKNQLDRERQARTPAEERAVSTELTAALLEKRTSFGSGVFCGAVAMLFMLAVVGWLGIESLQDFTALQATQQAPSNDATWKASEPESRDGKAVYEPSSGKGGGRFDHLASWFWSSAK
ncbi:MAG: hypothetical protein Q9157_007226 [Trypethelium eluteriae]